MQFDDSSFDLSGVEDQRGSGGGFGGGGMAIGGGGLGIVGVLAYLVFGVLSGGGGTGIGTIPDGTGYDSPSSSTSDLATRCTEPNAFQRYTDCRMVKVYNVADDVWSEELARRGVPYEQPRLVFFRSATRTACGNATADVGPFYCPADSGIYFDLTFLERLQRQLGAPGDFAQAYIAAHEFGHHIQNLTGTARAVRAAQGRTGEENAYSVALELQADCYAGVWSALAVNRGDDAVALDPSDVPEAITAAGAVGDDRIQSSGGGSVDPESFTHGSAAERQKWLTRGLDTGDPTSCTTFSERGLRL